MADRLPVLSGHVSEIPPMDLLQVLSLGRQFMVVNFHAADNAFLGRIWIKSGVIVDAEANDQRGLAAFSTLLFAPMAKTFQVFCELNFDRFEHEPLGQVTSLLMDAAVRQDHGANHAEPAPVAAPESTAGLQESNETTARPALSPVRSSPSPAVRLTPQFSPGVAGSAKVVALHSANKMGPAPQLTNRSRAKIVSFASPKGGVGKTTMALNLALSLAEQGLHILLVDTDPQGGIGLSLAGKTHTALGTYDVVLRNALLTDAIRSTRLEGFKILPAGGTPLEETPEIAGILANSQTWETLLQAAAVGVDLVLVDTAAGLFGTTRAIIGASDYVLAVMQAEVLSLRAMPALWQIMERFANEQRNVQLAGIIVNMLQETNAISANVLAQAQTQFPPDSILATSIPRDPVFLEATEKGIPAAFLGPTSTDMSQKLNALTQDITKRLGLTISSSSQRFLMVD